MANKNITLTDHGNNEQINPATTAEQIQYTRNNTSNNVKQELQRIEAVIEQYEN